MNAELVDELDDEPGESFPTCPQCLGMGTDGDDSTPCETCGGEGVIVD